MKWISPASVGLVLVLAALADPAAGQLPDADSAVGDVSNGNPQFFNHFVFDARSGPSGENPSGTISWTYRQGPAGGPVTCLNVTGNRATIGFENQFDPTGTLNGFVFVEDNGTPGVGRDNARGRLFVGPPPAVCPPNTLVYDVVFDTVTSGDLTVHDAPAFPTSKDQCKNGAWQTYGAFKNQGDCVSFVATKAKNEPSGATG